MNKKIKQIFILLLGFVFIFQGTMPVFAQDDAPLLTIASEQREAIISQDAQIDNNEGADLLGVSAPMLTPDSGLYFIKDWGRGIENMFTFSEEGKIKKRLEHASERLADVQAVINDPESIDKVSAVITKQQKDIEIAQSKLSAIQSTGEDYDQLYSDAIQKYSAMAKVMSSVEDSALDIDKDIVAQIYEGKESVLSDLGENMDKIDPEQIADIISAQPGSDYKEFRNLEILSEVADKVPGQAADAVLTAQKRIQDRLIDRFTLGVGDKQGEDFSAYVMNLKGSESAHVEILNELGKNTELPDEVIAGFRDAKDVVAEKFATKMIKHPASDEMMNDIASGDIDKLIVLEELADALPESNTVKATLDEARQKGLDLAVQKMTELGSVDDKINFLIRDGIPDAKSFVMLEQIQNKLPASQRSQMAQVRNQAFQIFSDIVDDAENSDKLLERLAGDSPKDVELIAVIKNNLPAGLGDKFDILAKKQLDKIETRISQETDVAKLLEMRSALDESPEAQSMMMNLSPEMMSNINKIQTAKISEIIDQATNTEDVIKISNQYNEMLTKFPDVANSIKANNPELINSIAMKQVERIKSDLANLNDPEKAREMMRNLQTAGLDKLRGSLPPELEKQISGEMSADARQMEKDKFMEEMKSRLGEDFDQATAEKMFEESIGSAFDSENGMPDEARIEEMKKEMEQRTSDMMKDTQKEKMIRRQVEEELSKNASPNAPSAGDVIKEIMGDTEVSDMNEAPSEDKINEIKARMEAEARAKAPTQTPPPGMTAPEGSAPSIPMDAPPSSVPSAPAIDCSQFASVPSCDMVPAIAQDACRKCK